MSKGGFREVKPPLDHFSFTLEGLETTFLSCRHWLSYWRPIWTSSKYVKKQVEKLLRSDKQSAFLTGEISNVAKF
jgi:hypothetical protein